MSFFAQTQGKGKIKPPESGVFIRPWLKWHPQVYRVVSRVAMPSFIPLKEADYSLLNTTLTENSWIGGCFCAQWCGACRAFKPRVKTFAEKYPDIVFLWIDIEDHADLLDDLDIENFPSLLIQYGDIVNFFGCVHPDIGLAERLLNSQTDIGIDEMKRLANSNEEHACWQKEVNIRTLLKKAVEAA